MEIAGTALSAAQTLFDALQCSQLKEKLSIFGYKSQLEDLQVTVEAITAVLRDAETKHELSHQQLFLIDELKDAVFDADDLFDEFLSLTEQKQRVEAGGSLRRKLRNFFSAANNPLSVAYRMSRGVKDVKKKLDAIAYSSQFRFNHDSEPIRRRRPETCSYVDKDDIIGREGDVEKIVSMLFSSNHAERNVSFLSIVGVGGLGKTALAQLVYGDPRVVAAFPLRLWTCISDEDQKQLDVDGILRKIFASVTGQKHEIFTMDQVQKQLREQLAQNRYLLVLDDVWTENRDQWRGLVKYFSGDQRGSWIMVTTRSQKTATVIGDGQMYELQGLSEQHSWQLFIRAAFGPIKSTPPDDLVEIGLEIVDGCARVPLAIKVVGSLLYGQDKSKWQSVREIGLANIRESENGIMDILKLSFHHLDFPLKSCFSYCALFPKDCEIMKEGLISLWMAQGYIVPLDKGQSIEDAGEEYFSILLRRCFFQDIKKDEFGEIKSCKIHDLMHDIAQSVSGKEIDVIDTLSGNLDKKVRHLSVACIGEFGKHSWGIRSLVIWFVPPLPVKALEATLANCRVLRVLVLMELKIEKIPDSIGDLLHLRYLDFSASNLVVLPKSITKLCNLETLILSGCKRLKELPKDLRKLIKLRFLHIGDCDKLTHMPWGMSELTCLQWLSDFIVGGEGSFSSWEQWFYGLEELTLLNNLKNDLRIQIRWPENDENIFKEDSAGKRLCLRSKEHVNALQFDFTFDEDYEEDDDFSYDLGEEDEDFSDDSYDEGILRLMEDLEPHSNLKKLGVWGYLGVKFPSWLSLLQNLVLLRFECSDWLQYLPCMRNLPHLKSLSLHNLVALEYIEEDTPSLVDSSSTMPTSSGLGCTADEEPSFFPSLEQLELNKLPKLKGWRRGVESSCGSNQPLLPCLPQVKSVIITSCPELTCIPMCPTVEKLYLQKFNKGLQSIIKLVKKDEKLGEVVSLSSSASAPSSSLNTMSILAPKLREVEIDNVAWLDSLPTEAFQCLECLRINGDKELVDLPDCMQFLPAIQSLEIRHCKGLKAMPNWMPKLTSLKKLELVQCSEYLNRRCKDSPGEEPEDWPYIKHIPFIICIGNIGAEPPEELITLDESFRMLYMLNTQPNLQWSENEGLKINSGSESIVKRS